MGGAWRCWGGERGDGGGARWGQVGPGQAEAGRKLRGCRPLRRPGSACPGHQVLLWAVQALGEDGRRLGQRRAPAGDAATPELRREARGAQCSPRARKGPGAGTALPTENNGRLQPGQGEGRAFPAGPHFPQALGEVELPILPTRSSQTGGSREAAVGPCWSTAASSIVVQLILHQSQALCALVSPSAKWGP